MIDKYNELFLGLKEYLTENSTFDIMVEKNYLNKKPYFPLVVCQLSNIVNTDFCTVDMIEQHEEMYLTTNVYTKDKKQGANIVVPSQVINDEITKLVNKYFESKKLKRTQCRMIPNIDEDILRRNIYHQGLVSNSRGNITRR